MKIKTLLLVSFSILMLASCTKDSMLTPKVAPYVPPVVNTSVSFSKDVYPIVTTKGCTCHGTGASAGLTLLGTSSSAVVANLIKINAVVPNKPNDSKFFTYFMTSPAKHNGMTFTFSQTELDNIFSWISAGAKDN